jgi:hypothetical protein
LPGAKYQRQTGGNLIKPGFLLAALLVAHLCSSHESSEYPTTSVNKALTISNSDRSLRPQAWKTKRENIRTHQTNMINFSSEPPLAQGIQFGVGEGSGTA